MRRLRVLITNHSLAAHTGSELYVRDLALALQDRGDCPVVYSPVLGHLAEALRRATIPVVDDVDRVAEPPDLIHGQHHLETMTALLRFPGTPALFVCHGWLPPDEAPPRFPRILRYVAVDDTCRDRLTLEHGIPPEQVRVILNFVDLERFRPRGPLPECPRRALVFSNYASEETHLPPIREACVRAGIELEVIGLASGRPSREPEAVLGDYDLVFAKGRAALEALAVGAAVVLCDATGCGPLVTTANLPGLRRLNFGIRALRHPATPELLGAEIARYDPDDAATASRRIREEAGRESAVTDLLALYEEVLEAYAGTTDDPAAEGQAAAAYLRSLVPQLRRHDRMEAEIGHLHAVGGEFLRRRLRRLPLLGRFF